MRKAFQWADLDKSGSLNRSEIARALEMWNIPLDEKKLDQLMAICDKDGDGEVSYAEFVNALARDTVGGGAYGGVSQGGGPSSSAEALQLPLEPLPPPSPTLREQRLEEKARLRQMRIAKGSPLAQGGSQSLVVDEGSPSNQPRGAPVRGVTAFDMQGLQDGLNSRFSDMHKAFQYCDVDKSGTLNRAEIARALKLWNVPMSMDKIDALMTVCDTDGDGEVSYAEFVNALARDTVRAEPGSEAYEAQVRQAPR